MKGAICSILLGLLHCVTGVKFTGFAGPRFRIATIVHEPFVMLSKSGNGYEGYLIDLLQILQSHIDFRYQVHIVPDHAFGKKKKNGQWTGLVGELVNGHAEMSLAPLIITPERQEVVNFSVPFMTEPVTLLMRKTKKGHRLQVQGLLDLVKLANHTFGPTIGSHIYSVFEGKTRSVYPVYSNISAHIQDNYNLLPYTISQAEALVRNQSFVFIGQKTTCDIILNKPPCNLHTVATDITYSYGLAFPKTSIFPDFFSDALHQLHEEGVLIALQEKWWPTYCQGSTNWCICD